MSARRHEPAYLSQGSAQQTWSALVLVSGRSPIGFEVFVVVAHATGLELRPGRVNGDPNGVVLWRRKTGSRRNAAPQTVCRSILKQTAFASILPYPLPEARSLKTEIIIAAAQLDSMGTKEEHFGMPPKTVILYLERSDDCDGQPLHFLRRSTDRRHPSEFVALEDVPNPEEGAGYFECQRVKRGPWLKWKALRRVSGP